MNKQTIHIGMDADLLEQIDEFMKQYPHNWSNKTHFVRCSLIYYLRGLREGRIKPMQ